MPNLSTFPLQGKAEEQSQNILGWEEKSKQAITAFFDFANVPCPEGETLKGSVNTIIDMFFSVLLSVQEPACDFLREGRQGVRKCQTVEGRDPDLE